MGSIGKLKIIHIYFPKGDSGYALRSWMLTPIKDVRNGTQQSHFNKMQMSTRSVIERVNGISKMRLRFLLQHRVLHYDPGQAYRGGVFICSRKCSRIEKNVVENVVPGKLMQ